MLLGMMSAASAATAAATAKLAAAARRWIAVLPLGFRTATHGSFQLENKRKDYTVWRQFYEQPSIIPGCPETLVSMDCMLRLAQTHKLL